MITILHDDVTYKGPIKRKYWPHNFDLSEQRAVRKTEKEYTQK
jgi:hypothetical protein